MKLVITEKNDAAQKIAEILGSKKVKKDKVYTTPVYRFERNGEEWVTIGLRGHILEPDFAPSLVYKKRGGWQGVTAEGELVPATIPNNLPKPPFATKRKPFTADGLDLKGWKMDALPYLVYSPIEKMPKEKGIIQALKNLAKKADGVIIATDFDREGELIGADALGCVLESNPALAPTVRRARYSSFTKEEITHAFDNLVDLDTCLANAGESRQDIDLIWGAVLTRYLTLVKFAGYGNTRSSGRVQTPTLALIVARERERMAFVPEDYWTIRGNFCEGEDRFDAPHAHGKFKVQGDADKVMARIAGESPIANEGPEGDDSLKIVRFAPGERNALVRSVEKKTRTQSAPAPFNTTSLMAAAASEGIAPGRTMRIAEGLYMKGYISYPRTDNTVYPATLDLRDIVRQLSANPNYASHCQSLLSKGKLTPTKGKKESTDHPPIYPTACVNPDQLPAADYKIYNLIARRFLATVSDAAVIESTIIELDVNDETFKAKGDVIVKPGYRAIYPYGLRKDEVLPALVEGQLVPLNSVSCEKKQTEPPARYSQGTLIQEMEKLGLGTKATRANIIDRLYEVKYIMNDPIEPSQLGMAVIDALDAYAHPIVTPDMTAELESEMDAIAAGETTKDEVVMNSRMLLAEQLAALLPRAAEVKAALGDAVAADAYVGVCPKCGKDLQIRTSQKSKSMFIGCSGWPECDVTYGLPPQGKVEALETTCPECGLPQIKVTPFRAKAQTLCIDPECPTRQEKDVPIGFCPNCAAEGIQSTLFAKRNSRTMKRFIRCENHDHCGTSYPLPQKGTLTPTEEVCPDCGAPFVIISSPRRAPWKLCPNMNCPGKEKKEDVDGQAVKATTGKKAAGKKTSSKKTASSKTAGKKTAGE